VRKETYIPPFKGGQGREPGELTQTAGFLGALGLCGLFWALLWWWWS